MTVYFEGNGTPRVVTVAEARDQLVHALKEARDEILNDPALEAYDDTPTRDLHVANRMIGGVLGIMDGSSEHYPGVNLIPYCTDEDMEEAKAAGANYFDNSYGDIGGGMQAYWEQVSS